MKRIYTPASCDFAISTKILAAGWTTSRKLTTVAPSLEIVALPLLLFRLSIPLGARFKGSLNNIHYIHTSINVAQHLSFSLR